MTRHLSTRLSLLFSLAAMLVLIPACDQPAPESDETAEPAAADQASADQASADQASEAASSEESDSGPLVSVIKPGPEAAKQAQETLILAEPGDVIEFDEGTFEFDKTLSLDGTDQITIRGQGIEKTILDFSNQQKGSGGEGIKVTSNHFLIEDLTIQDSPGDAIKITDSEGVTFRRVRTWWSGGPKTENGAYGIYPVMCKQVLIEHCVAECASDAGIYVGDSEQTIVRYNRAERTVAGIEIENTIGADVYENVATGNTGGLLVFSLPGLTIKNGRHTRVYNNEVYDNNLENFAPKGTAVAGVPPGTGVMVMSNDDVEVFENEISGNQTANVAVVSYRSNKQRKDDPEFDPYPEGIYIHDNKIADGGSDPQGELGKLYAQHAEGPMPDIVIDGVVNPEKLENGELPADEGVRIANNGDATFVNLNLPAIQEGGEPQFITDKSKYEGKLDALAAVEIPGVE